MTVEPSAPIAEIHPTITREIEKTFAKLGAGVVDRISTLEVVTLSQYAQQLSHAAWYQVFGT